MPEKIHKKTGVANKKQGTEGRLTIDVKEAAAILGIGMNNMYRLLESEDFPKVKIGRQYKIIRSLLPDWLEKNKGLKLLI